MPRARVPHEGRWVKATNVPFGEPILLTREEWGARTQREWRRVVVRTWTFNPTICFLFFLPWLVFIPGVPLWPNALAMTAVLAFGLPVVMTVLTSWSLARVRRRGIYSGLYENGLVAVAALVTTPVFLPYGMIEEVKVSRVNLFNKMLVIKVRGFKRAMPFDLSGILGDRGLVVLRHMVTRPPVAVDQGPPELHIYGGRGLRISSIPRMSEDAEDPD